MFVNLFLKNKLFPAPHKWSLLGHIYGAGAPFVENVDICMFKLHQD